MAGVGESTDVKLIDEAVPFSEFPLESLTSDVSSYLLSNPVLLGLEL